VTYKDLKAGALFNIPLAKGVVALGQIVRPGIEFYMCAFLPPLAKADAPTPPLKKLSPAVCALTTDAPFQHGRWTLRGEEQAIHADIPYPHFQVNDYSKGVIVEDVNGKVVRKATAADEERIPLRTNVGEDNVTELLEALIASAPLPEDSEHMLVDFIRERQ
jgi:hypothetical protein